MYVVPLEGGAFYVLFMIWDLTYCKQKIASLKGFGRSGSKLNLKVIPKL